MKLNSFNKWEEETASGKTRAVKNHVCLKFSKR